MVTLVTALLLFAQLGAPFTDASASGTRQGDRIEVNLEVGVDALNISTILAHVADPGGEQTTATLNDRGSGRYGAVLTLPAADVVVVFEALAPGDSVLSQPVTLTSLGLDPVLLEPDRPFATVEPEPDDAPLVSRASRRWGWAAVGLLATSLALLALWAAGPRQGPRRAQVAGDAPGDDSPGPSAEPEEAEPEESAEVLGED